MINYALQSYQLALEKNQNSISIFKWRCYRIGHTDMMITTFLDEAAANPQNSIMIQNQLSRFMIEDADANFNDALRKTCY